MPFQPFSSGGQSSHLQTPQTTPLRKRENDSFASPEAPLLWRQPLQPATGALHNHNTYSPSVTAASSHFADLNFSHNTRRRGRLGSRNGAQFWIPWVMKAILASPLIVLMFWFVAVALHHPTESSAIKKNRYGVGAKATRSLLQQQQQQNLLTGGSRKHPGNDKKTIPVYVPMGSSDQQQQQMFPQAGMQSPQLLWPRSGWGNNFLKAIHPMGQGQNGFMLGQPQHMAMPGQNMMQLTTQQQAGQVYQQAQQQPFMLQQMEPQLMQAQPQYIAQNQMQLQQQPLQLTEQTESQPVMMAAGGSTHKHNQRPAHPGRLANLRGGRNSPKGSQQTASGQQLKVYYYDPAEAVVEGQLQAPSVVYDEHGKEVAVTSLALAGSELLIEPPIPELMASPVYGSTHSSGSNRRLIISSNATNSTVPLPPLPLEMKFKTPEAWGESTTQDQSIIIVTVATMALLVGALSARRLRSRSFLSSCIENESLEDEVAYDNAYTIAGGDSYNTFGWKGDLEKFDV